MTDIWIKLQNCYRVVGICWGILLNETKKGRGGINELSHSITICKEAGETVTTKTKKGKARIKMIV